MFSCCLKFHVIASVMYVEYYQKCLGFVLIIHWNINVPVCHSGRLWHIVGRERTDLIVISDQYLDGIVGVQVASSLCSYFFKLFCNLGHKRQHCNKISSYIYITSWLYKHFHFFPSQITFFHIALLAVQNIVDYFTVSLSDYVIWNL